MDEYDLIKYYISCEIENPTSEDFDAQYIADSGNTFPKNAGDVLFGVK
jgi:hypothetical protein